MRLTSNQRLVRSSAQGEVICSVAGRADGANGEEQEEGHAQELGEDSLQEGQMVFICSIVDEARQSALRLGRHGG